MTKKLVKEERILEFSDLDFDHNFYSVLKTILDIKSEMESEPSFNHKINIDSYDSYGHLEITWDRFETDKECAYREYWEAKLKEQAREQEELKERELYEKLKAKFEGQ